MDQMAILAKKQNGHEENFESERGGGSNNPPPLLRERVNQKRLTIL